MAPTGQESTALRLRIPASPDAPGLARRAVGALPVAEALLEELRFLVGEVVAERVCGSGGEPIREIGLEVSVAPRTVRAEFRSTVPPPLADVPREREGRRWEALASVLEALALRWGVSDEEGGSLWFELARDLAGEAHQRLGKIQERLARAYRTAATVHERAARYHDDLSRARRRQGDLAGSALAEERATAEHHRAQRARFMARRAETRRVALTAA